MLELGSVIRITSTVTTGLSRSTKPAKAKNDAKPQPEQSKNQPTTEPATRALVSTSAHGLVVGGLWCI